jgi:hypothetical protein
MAAGNFQVAVISKSDYRFPHADLSVLILRGKPKWLNKLEILLSGRPGTFSG